MSTIAGSRQGETHLVGITLMVILAISSRKLDGKLSIQAAKKAVSLLLNCAFFFLSVCFFS